MAIIGVEGDPHTDGDEDLMAVNGKGGCEEPDNFFGQAGRILIVDKIILDDDKLVTSQAGHSAHFPQQ